MDWKFTLSNTIAGNLVLDDEPIGWADIILNMKRDMTWHGVFFESAIALKFYSKGYDYIKSIYDSQSREAYIGIQIDSKCDDSSNFTSFFAGKLILVKTEFDCSDQCIVQVPIEQAGCLMQFKNRMDQSVDLSANKDFDGNALTAYSKLPFDLTLLAKAIVLRSLAYNHAIDENENIPFYHGTTQSIANGTGTQRIDDIAYLEVPIHNIFLNDLSINDEGVAIFDNLGSCNPFGIVPFTGKYDFNFLVGIDTSISMEAPSPSGPVGIAFCGGGSSAFFHDLTAILHLYVNGASVASTTIDSYTGNCATGHRIVSNPAISLITSQNLTKGDALKLVIRFTVGGDYHRNLLNTLLIRYIYTAGGHTNKSFSEVTIKATIKAPPTPCKVFAINEAFSRTVEAITDDCMRVKSNYFGRTDSQPYTSGSDGCGSLEVITKGLLIRQFPSTMPVSFKDIYDSLSAIHNIGMGPEPDSNRPGNDWLRIEPMEYFYDSSTVLLQCDNVPAVKKVTKPEWDPSTIEIGYNKWETENSMGLDEFCTRRSYRTALSEVQNGISKRCTFIASGYSIEVTRNKEFIQDSTVDWRYDNDIFIICVHRDSGNMVVEQGIDCADTGTMINILDPDTIYNYRISPIRNFMRWIKLFMSAYFTDINAANAKFIFTNGDGNFLAKGKLLNGCIEELTDIAENEDVSKSKFLSGTDATPIFKNELDEFDYPLSLADSLIIRANPRGLIQYRRLSTDAWSAGYISNIQYKPNDGIATFTLLPKY